MIPYDKKLHMIAGFVISLAGGIILNPVIGLLSALLAGTVKEIVDYFDYGKFDFQDLIATFIGGIGGVVWVLLLTLLRD